MIIDKVLGMEGMSLPDRVNQFICYRQEIVNTSLDQCSLKGENNPCYLEQPLEKCDVVCIQEYWLGSFECNEITHNSSHSAIVKSFNEHSCLPMYCPRGTAGLAVLWEQDIEVI